MTRRGSYAALFTALLVLAGCGSGTSDSDRIAAIVKNEGTNPASICQHLSQALVNRLGGQRACLAAAGSSPADPSTHAKAISVHGNTATAVVVDKAGTSTVALFKQDGTWKVSAVR